jgi:hypothetical protein
MIFYEEWVNNYNTLLNILYNNFLVISEKKGINFNNNNETFNHFCYMIYHNSQNRELKNAELFSYMV